MRVKFEIEFKSWREMRSGSGFWRSELNFKVVEPPPRGALGEPYIFSSSVLFQPVPPGKQKSSDEDGWDDVGEVDALLLVDDEMGTSLGLSYTIFLDDDLYQKVFDCTSDDQIYLEVDFDLDDPYSGTPDTSRIIPIEDFNIQVQRKAPRR
ncbi:hypothetical protein ACVCL3_16940 [Rhodanobacter sp. UC4437_H4]